MSLKYEVLDDFSKSSESLYSTEETSSRDVPENVQASSSCGFKNDTSENAHLEQLIYREAENEKDETNGNGNEGGNGIARRDSTVDDPNLKKCYDALAYFSGKCKSSFSNSSNGKTSEPPTDSNIVTEELIDPRGDVPFADVEIYYTMTDKDVVEVMKNLSSIHYRASGTKLAEDAIFCNCKGLIEKDYYCDYVDNYGGVLSDNYPVRLIIPVRRNSERNLEGLLKFDKELYSDLAKCSVSSRCRTRFAVPVILFDNKLICRSATLSVRKAAAFELALQYEPQRDLLVNENIFQTYLRGGRNFIRSMGHRARSYFEGVWHLLDRSSVERVRELDKEMLKNLKVEYICDLMIEERKMFLQTIAVSSSEKINRAIYDDFKIEQMPYPGCHLFARYHANNRDANGLIFNWQRADVNTTLELSEDPHIEFPDIDWDNYKSWDVIVLTQNYLKVLLSYIVKGTGGLLVHCISGWDRTPLMISLLRMSLWADGVIHESLNTLDMAYLTLGYDWFLFGHDLPRRLRQKQEIMHFCFNFLQHIASDEYSVTRKFQQLKPEVKGDRVFPEFTAGRRNVLNDLSTLVLSIYDENITRKRRWTFPIPPIDEPLHCEGSLLDR